MITTDATSSFGELLKNKQLSLSTLDKYASFGYQNVQRLREYLSKNYDVSLITDQIFKF